MLLAFKKKKIYIITWKSVRVDFTVKEYQGL